MLAGYDHLLTAAARLQWDAEAIPLDGDRARARELDRDARTAVTELVAGFWVAEHAVATELAPFIAATAPDSPARACFVQQAIDEARHARFFDRLLTEVLGLDRREARARCPPPIVELFEVALPARARSLAADVQEMPAAVSLYHLVLEAIVFAIGQEALLALAADAGGLTGLADGAARVQADERWHVGLGVLHLQQLGASVELGREADAAAAAWGAAIATPERIARATATHARRMSVIARDRGGPPRVLESAP